jgi:hypothetical protein
MNAITNMTVSDLIDIVSSQLALHGNRKIFVMPEPSWNSVFELYAGENSIVDCMSDDDASVASESLEAMLENLAEIDENALVRCSDGAPALFQIGFKSPADGFIETVSSSELVRDTIIG